MKLNFQEHTAIFGGSFDPPHLGHVLAVKGVLQDLTLSKVMVLPSFGTPFKTGTTAFEHRFEMTKLAFQNLDRVEISDLEQSKNFKYSYEVLEYLSPNINKLAVVIGTDQFELLHKWARYPELTSLCDWVVLLRKPMENGAETENLSNPAIKAAISQYVSQGWLGSTQHEFQFKIKGVGASKERNLYFIPTLAGPLSSTLVRQKFALGDVEAVKKLVAPNVIEYVKRHKLYGN